MNLKLGAILLLFLALYTQAQQTNIPLDFQSQNNIEKELLRSNSLTFTSQRPLLYSNLHKIINVDSMVNMEGRDSIIITKLKHPSWWRKLRTEDLIIVKKNGFILKINPLMNFASGSSDFDKKKLMINSRGVDITGSLGKKFSFGSGVYESQAIFSNYYSEFIKDRAVVPGQGRVRLYKENGYDFSQAYGYLSFSPSGNINFQMGHGKHFIGEGYRSLILSDNSFNMPYAKLSVKRKRMRYTNLIVAYQNTKIADGTSEISNRKYGSYTSLDFLIGKFMEIGLTESIVWGRKDSLSYFPNLNLYNPIILFRTFQYGMDGENNVLLALNTKIKISKSIVSYGQFIFDNNDKTAYQIGVKWFDVFKTKLFVQLEYNSVQPYTYTSWSKQSFTHYNQEIAHPLGANFSELFCRFKYKWKDVLISYQYNLASRRLNENFEAYGSNIFIPYLSSDETQINKKEQIVNHSFTLAYLINPVSNLQLYFEARIRNWSIPNTSEKENIWLFGIKTNLQNLYSDF